MGERASRASDTPANGTRAIDPESQRVRMTVTFANDAVVVGWWQSVLISVWKRDQHPEYAQRRGEAAEVLAQSRPGPLLLLTVVTLEASLPDEPTRDALAKLRLALSHQRVVACAGIAEGPPIRVAGARAVSISLDQRVVAPFPTRMFAQRIDAVVWLREAFVRAGGEPFRGRDLLAAIAPNALP
jgi:hypothetical protein